MAWLLIWRGGLWLILIFVIGMLANAKASVGRSENRMPLGHFQYSAKASDAQPSSPVVVTYPTGAIQLCPLLLDVCPFLWRQNAADIEITKCPIEPGSKAVPVEIKSGGHIRISGQHPFVSSNMASHTDLPKDGISRPCIHADQICSNRHGLRNIASEPEMLNPHFWPMGREKFGTGETNLEKIKNSQSGSSECKDASECHEPQSVGSDGLFGGLMPFFYGLGGGFVLVLGGGVLAWRLWGV